MTRSATPWARPPICVILPSLIHTSARYRGTRVPSTTVPPVMWMSASLMRPPFPFGKPYRCRAAGPHSRRAAACAGDLGTYRPADADATSPEAGTSSELGRVGATHDDPHLVVTGGEVHGLAQVLDHVEVVVDVLGRRGPVGGPPARRRGRHDPGVAPAARRED